MSRTTRAPSRWVVAVAVSAAAVLLVSSGAAAAPGFASLVVLSVPAGAASPPNVEASAIACPAPNDCVAVGSASLRSFVDSETSGVWAKAQLVPEISGAVDQTLNAVSCTAVGQCLAVGVVVFTSGGSATSMPYVVAENAGSWSLPTDAVPNPGDAGFLAVSCSAYQDCIAVGWDASPSSSSEGFADTEMNGVWQPSVGLAETPSGAGYAQPTALSCWSAGCVLVGDYEDPDSTTYPPSGGYEQEETGGTWGPLHILTRGLNQFTQLTSVSCVSADACVAVGSTDSNDVNGVERPIGVQEHAGAWGPVRELPVFSPAANDAELDAVACERGNACVAAGQLFLTSGGLHDVGFVRSRAVEYSLIDGVWSTPAVLPQAEDPSGPAVAADLDAVTCGISTCEGAGIEVRGSASYAEVAKLSPSGAPGRPAAPVALEARHIGATVSISWGQPIGSGGVPIAYYVVSARELGVGILRATAKRPHLLLTGIRSTRTLVIFVRARNVAGITGPAARVVLRGRPT